ncbi:hypothetical protein ODJ79_16490 [Actinoplanes sp. KI2]|uniref:hypothetical protein n=1 Tax=Actinoplanes sp. KI2 TaxID=2983315 RepID=UPI0021D5FC19|nr:hypothetical protein [Actinoplanes sp. KI2]MCU7725327.1 hypothetical protein [Actinoplanes sp. KI2]
MAHAVPQPPRPGAAERPAAAVGPRRVNVRPGSRAALVAGTTSAASSPAGCGGVLTFGKIYRCSAIKNTQRDVFTVTTTADHDTLYGTFTQGSGDPVSAAVYDPAGNYLCYYSSYPGQCQLGAAGKYTVVITLSYGTGSQSYTFAADSMKTPSSCRTLGNGFFSWASAGHPGQLAQGSAGDCYIFDQPTGSVLQMWAPGGTGDVRGGILDANYQPACPVQYTTQCVLTGPAPYHVMMYEFYGNASPYTLRMARISASAGCPVLRPVSFGDPGNATGTGTLPSQSSVACHKLRTPAAGGVAVRIYDDQQVWWTVYDNAGTQVCDKYSQASSCPLSAAGDYTIVTSSQAYDSITYVIAIAALFRSAGCTTVKSFAWDQAATVLRSVSPVQTNCQQFHGTAGQRVVTYSAPVSYNGVLTTLVDGTGQALCLGYSDETGCLLPADGTYRVVSRLSQWDSNTSNDAYKTQVRTLSAPTGCPVVEPGAYDGAPAGAAGPIRCRALRISGPGVYQARAYDAQNYRKYAAVYDRTGHRICDDSGYCQFPAAGDYTMVLDGQNPSSVIDTDFAYVTSLLPARPAGCPILSQNLYPATFTSTGQFLCRQLSEPTGASIVDFQSTDAADGGRPFTQIMDSTGNTICDSSYQLWQTSCLLTGTAPYFAVLNEPEGVAPASFAARFARVDGPSSCPALDGSPVTTGAADFVACRTIPADGHGSRESFTWTLTSGTGGAYLSVFGADGTRYCGPTRTADTYTANCGLPDGPLTVYLDAASADATYQITHQSATTS